MVAYGKAMEEVRSSLGEPVPMHLRNATTGLMRQMGYGRGYKYAHEYEDHYVEQTHLPERLAGHRYYEPGSLGHEANIKEWWENVRKGDARDGGRE
jgi:putative ATPase